MATTTERLTISAEGFAEAEIEADGFRIRYLAAGEGDSLICLHGGNGLRLSGVHRVLAEHRRVIAFEVPGFGLSPLNERSTSFEDLASTMNAAVSALGIDRFSLMGNSFGGRLALWMAVIKPEPIDAVVLIAPAAIRPEGASPMERSPENTASLLYAHPERQPPAEPTPPEIWEKQRALVRRLAAPPRDPALESRMAGLEAPVLALFGTEDCVVPPTVARLYREILPNCNVVMVYDAAHAIDAERPEAVSSVVDDFLNRHESFLVSEQSGLIHP